MFSLLFMLSCAPTLPADPGEPLLEGDELVQGALPEGQLPPPPTMQLEVNNLYAGEYAMLRITGAPPGALLRIAHGRALGDGPCPAVLSGLCLDIVSPVRLSPTAAVADDDGEAGFAFRLPNRRGSAVVLQVAVTGASPAISNPVYRPVGGGLIGGESDDLDNDGFTPAAGDCADFDAGFSPIATDMLGDGVDQNCDDADGVDDDRDTWASVASGGADCDDEDPEVSPEAIEVCNGVDDECDGQSDPPGTCAECDLPWGGTLPHGDDVEAWLTGNVAWDQTCSSQTRACDDGVLSGTYTAQTCTVTPPLDCSLPWGGTLAHGSSVTAYAASSVPFGSTCTSSNRTCTNGVLSGTGTFQSCTVQAPTQEYMGCYHDNLSGVRDMPHQISLGSANSVDACVTACRNAGYAYAGPQFSTECFCGNSYGSQGLASHHGRGCDRTCPANSGQICGGANANSVWATAAPVVKTLLGCYKDNTSGVRDLTANQGALSYNNIGGCTSKCRQLGYSYAGVQFGSNCFCGNTAGSQGNGASGGVSCGMACSGAAAESCGGSNANAIYAVKATALVSEYLGCYNDPVGDPRDLPVNMGSNTKNNSLWCTSKCRDAGYTYAGLQFGNECFCGNTYGGDGTAAAAGRSCNMTCPGNSTEMCGGNQANSVYRVR